MRKSTTKNIRSQSGSAAVVTGTGELGIKDALALAAAGAGFAAQLGQEQDSLDLLINNAGVMTPPKAPPDQRRFRAAVRHELSRPFHLTAHLLPLSKRGTNPRVVTIGSIAARNGAINFDGLQQRRYKPMQVHGQSKLACVMFAFALSRRSKASGWRVESLGAHPGVTRTDLIANGAGRSSINGMVRRFLPFLFEPAWQGALPALYAAPTSSGGRRLLWA